MNEKTPETYDPSETIRLRLFKPSIGYDKYVDIMPSQMEYVKLLERQGFQVSRVASPKTNNIDAFLGGVLRGASFELEEEIYGLLGGDEVQLEAQKQRQREDIERPGAVLAGQVVGSLIGAPAKVAGAGVKLASKLGPIGARAIGSLLGAGEAAVTGVAAKPMGEKDDISLGNAASIALGGVLGGLTTKVGGSKTKGKPKGPVDEIELNEKLTNIRKLKQERALEIGIPDPQYRTEAHRKFLSEDQIWKKLNQAEEETMKRLRDVDLAEISEMLLGRKANIQTQIKQLDDEIRKVSKIRPKQVEARIKEIDDDIAKIKAQPKRSASELKTRDDLVTHNKRMAKRERVLKDLEKEKEELLQSIDEVDSYLKLEKMRLDKKKLLKKLEEVERDITDLPVKK